MRLLTIPFLFLMILSAEANQVLIPYFSKWKYLDNGVNQGTNWRTTSFVDTSWQSGYGQLGFGDNDESTTLSYGPNSSAKYITTYFRKNISIANPALFTNFTVNVRRDDGIVMYVNGVEVFRNNMPASPTVISFSTLASAAASDDGNTPQTATIASSNFVAGNNVIAVEIHQNAGTSSDLTFDMELVGNQSSTPVLSRGPYLMMATPTSIKVRWRTRANSNAKVFYGLAENALNSSVTDATSDSVHIVTLTGLTPNTKYYYSIGSTTATLMGTDENYFVTPPATNTIKATRIWATGDFGSGTVNATMVRNAYLKYTGNTYTDMWLWLGDNAYDAGLDSEFTANVFDYRYERIFRRTCLWPSPGNHDYANVGYQSGSALGTSFAYFSNFSTPQSAEAGGYPSNSPKYYSYNFSNIHLISLDSYGALNNSGSPMYTWLQNDLAQNTQRWTIVYFHHAPYTKGSHDSDTETELVRMRTNITPLLEMYKVDLVLSGHSHSYERSFLIKNHTGVDSTFTAANQVDAGSGTMPTPYVKSFSNGFTGTVYAVVGCSGQTTGQMQAGYPHNAMYTSTVNTFGSMVIDINGDTLNAKMLTNELTTPTFFDQFTIIRPCKAAPVISGFSPASGPPGSLVTINGSDFSTVTAVRFNGINATSYTVVNSNQITAIVPANGSGTVSVITSACGNGNSTDPFVLSSGMNLSAHILIQGFYRGGGAMIAITNPGITDTVTLQLASANSPYNILYSSTSTINTSGNGTFSFTNVPLGFAYYIVVKHRNTLETWSAAPVMFNSTSLSYDFTTALSVAYGNNLKDLGDGKFALFSGDINQDRAINSNDYAYLDSNTWSFTSSYLPQDLTGDLLIESSDCSLLENNAFPGISVLKP